MYYEKGVKSLVTRPHAPETKRSKGHAMPLLSQGHESVNVTLITSSTRSSSPLDLSHYASAKVKVILVRTSQGHAVCECVLRSVTSASDPRSSIMS